MSSAVTISSMTPSSYKGTLLLPAIDTSLPASGQNVSIEAQTLLSGASLEYDIGFYAVSSTYTSDQYLGRFEIVRNITYANNFTPSIASCLSTNTASASASISIYQNSNLIGSIVFEPSSTTGTFSSAASATSLSVGDILSFVSPTLPDLTLGNISVTFTGTLT